MSLFIPANPAIPQSAILIFLAKNQSALKYAVIAMGNLNFSNVVVTIIERGHDLAMFKCKTRFGVNLLNHSCKLRNILYLKNTVKLVSSIC